MFLRQSNCCCAARSWDGGYTPTSYDVHSKSIRAGDKLCRFDIVETGGQEPINTTWYSKGWEETNRDAVVLVYDTNSRTSFESIPGLFDPTKHPRDAIIMLVGSQIDQKEQRQVRPEEGMVLAKKLGGTFWEVSSRKGHGINTTFRYLALSLLERQNEHLNDATEANAETPQESFWEPKIPRKSWRAYFTSVVLPCTRRAKVVKDK
jgi:GTPase SAR1 family protein